MLIFLLLHTQFEFLCIMILLRKIWFGAHLRNQFLCSSLETFAFSFDIFIKTELVDLNLFTLLNFICCAQCFAYVFPQKFLISICCIFLQFNSFLQCSSLIFYLMQYFILSTFSPLPRASVSALFSFFFFLSTYSLEFCNVWQVLGCMRENFCFNTQL